MPKHAATTLPSATPTAAESTLKPSAKTLAKPKGWKKWTRKMSRVFKGKKKKKQQLKGATTTSPPRDLSTPKRSHGSTNESPTRSEKELDRRSTDSRDWRREPSTGQRQSLQSRSGSEPVDEEWEAQQRRREQRDRDCGVEEEEEEWEEEDMYEEEEGDEEAVENYEQSGIQCEEESDQAEATEDVYEYNDAHLHDDDLNNEEELDDETDEFQEQMSRSVAPEYANAIDDNTDDEDQAVADDVDNDNCQVEYPYEISSDTLHQEAVAEEATEEVYEPVTEEDESDHIEDSEASEVAGHAHDDEYYTDDEAGEEEAGVNVQPRGPVESEMDDQNEDEDEPVGEDARELMHRAGICGEGEHKEVFVVSRHWQENDQDEEIDRAQSDRLHIHAPVTAKLATCQVEAPAQLAGEAAGDPTTHPHVDNQALKLFKPPEDVAFVRNVAQWCSYSDNTSLTVEAQLLAACIARQKWPLAQLLAKKLDRDHRCSLHFGGKHRPTEESFTVDTLEKILTQCAA